ncbi:MAG: metallophosphoesterase [Deltaproteobacteria bacterium]|nr:metallophosphoesterase [Deltaproteobacteria bacterium]
MSRCFFASDLHGHRNRYEKLFERLRAERPQVLLLGGDLTPNPFVQAKLDSWPPEDFFAWLAGKFDALRKDLGSEAPRVLLIMGNDDLRVEETVVEAAAARGSWEYLHMRRVLLDDGDPVYGYACVSPSPFLLKDWERYDVSRYVDPGCVSPEEGSRSVPVTADEARYGTIQKDLDELTGSDALEQALFLFHAPPYKSKLDRAALDGKMIDHVPLDVHVGSIAIQRFIEKRQPKITLHGHIHESASITGAWQDQIGRTHCFSAAHDGPELALVEFDTEQPDQARRRLL